MPSTKSPNPTRDWHPGKMITVERATSVASSLYPGEVHEGPECTPGCPTCRDRAAEWEDRKVQVRNAMLAAFGHDPVKVHELEKEEKADG